MAANKTELKYILALKATSRAYKFRIEPLFVSNYCIFKFYHSLPSSFLRATAAMAADVDVDVVVATVAIVAAVAIALKPPPRCLLN